MNRESLLRPALLIDAVTCIATGLLLVLAAGPLSALLGLPEMLLREAGIILFPFAAFVLWASRRLDAGPVRIVIAANAAWVIASIALIAGPWVQPNALGIAFVGFQAAAVAALALAQAASLSARARIA